MCVCSWGKGVPQSLVPGPFPASGPSSFLGRGGTPAHWPLVPDPFLGEGYPCPSLGWGEGAPQSGLRAAHPHPPARTRTGYPSPPSPLTPPRPPPQQDTPRAGYGARGTPLAFYAGGLVCFTFVFAQCERAMYRTA